MGDLAEDTAVDPAGDGRYLATLSQDWNHWGPNGGYLAALVLRAAGMANPGRLPASLSCHFLNVAEFAPVELRVAALRTGRRTAASRVSVTQQGRSIVDATVWAVGDADARGGAGGGAGGAAVGAGGGGPARTWGPQPPAPEPESLQDIAKLVEDEGGQPLTLWRNYEIRPTGWRGWAKDRPAGEPRLEAWFRMRHRATFGDDPWLDAARIAIAADIAQFPAIAQGFATSELTFTAPNLDLFIAFHAADPDEEWLFVTGEGITVGGGLGAARATIWSRHGKLLATGMQQMLVTTPRGT